MYTMRESPQRPLEELSEAAAKRALGKARIVSSRAGARFNILGTNSRDEYILSPAADPTEQKSLTFEELRQEEYSIEKLVE